MTWAAERQSRYVCACNVHSVVSARKSTAVRVALDSSDLNLADGAPIAWILRRRGFHKQKRLAGPDFFADLCSSVAAEGLSIYLYGGSRETLVALQRRLLETYPGLHIAGTDCPPYRTLTREEDSEAITRINTSGAHIVFVCLGCPKQELWMAAHKNVVRATMVGVGAAFDFHSGLLNRAPRLFQALGLEWFHRLAQEPRRLWRRYLVTNSLFIMHMTRDWLSISDAVSDETSTEAER